MSLVAENLRVVQERIRAAAARAHRAVDTVSLIAVTKYVDVDRIQEALACGLTHLGENRVQDAQPKISVLSAAGDLRAYWHMIGHLQSNKASKAATIFDRIDSIDSSDIAQALDKRLAAAGKTVEALVEVNLSQEQQKTGLMPEKLGTLLEQWGSLQQLKLRGLMTMAPLSKDSARVRNVFRRLRELLDEMNEKQILPHRLDVLSMGMSDDFEIAIEEGATEVRIGRAIFEPRRTS